MSLGLMSCHRNVLQRASGALGYLVIYTTYLLLRETN